jgi:hypothetical protein
LDFVKTSLAALEVEMPEDIDDLPAVLESCQGVAIEMLLRTKGEFTNTYFNGLADIDSESVEEIVADEEVEEASEEELEEEPVEEEVVVKSAPPSRGRGRPRK